MAWFGWLCMLVMVGFITKHLGRIADEFRAMNSTLRSMELNRIKDIILAPPLGMGATREKIKRTRKKKK